MCKLFSEYFDLFNPWSGLSSDSGSDNTQLDKHLEKLKTLHTSGNDRKPLFDHLYDCLTIIDQKSASLFTANSILAAVFIFIASPFFSDKGELTNTEPLTIVLAVGLLCMMASSLLLVVVIKVRWSGLSDLPTNSDEASQEDYIKRLLKIRDSRTVYYRFALLGTFFSLLSLAIVLGVRFSPLL